MPKTPTIAEAAHSRTPPIRAAAAYLALILAFGFGVRLRAANHPYISQWDEAYHALVAKNLTAHPLEPTLYEEKVLPAGDRDWTKARVWLHKPPLPLWLMAAGIAAFGEGELSFRLPAVFLDTLAILLIYLLALELFGRASRLAGLIAAAVYAVNPLMIRLVSGRIPDDAPHVANVFFITGTILLFAVAARRNSRAYAAAAGLSLGLGTLCMTAVASLGLAASLPLLFSLRGVRGSLRLLAVAALTFAAAALPWPLYCLSRWPELYRHESALQTSHLFTALEGHAHAWWWYLKILPVQYGGSAVIAWASLPAVLVYAIREAIRRKATGLASALCWVVIPYVFFSVIATKLYSYVCVAVPGLCLLTGFAVAAAWAARNGRYRAAVSAVLLAAGAQFAWVCVERVRADYSACPWNELYDYPSFRRTMLRLREVRGPKVLLNVGDSKTPQAMYYSGAAAYPDAPSAAVVRGLLGRGYRVFVLVEEDKRGADVPPELKTAEFRKKIFFIPVPPPLVLDAKHPYEA
ncbi:MAG: glycosyltransferase family 39 protein [Elusimicrobia bacterium]|nr:glycosyltransferase family 39 protein [Elusimicrobiota bacterium]